MKPSATILTVTLATILTVSTGASAQESTTTLPWGFMNLSEAQVLVHDGEQVGTATVVESYALTSEHYVAQLPVVEINTDTWSSILASSQLDEALDAFWQADGDLND